MSHTVEIKTQVRDPIAVQAACVRLKLPAPVQGKHKLFSEEVAGLGVQLPGWKYPVVCELGSGSVRFDNYNGHWGDRKQLDALLQAYAVEKARTEARKKGYTVTEQPLSNGSIKLTIQVSGGVA